VKLLDPTTLDSWDVKVAALPGASFFHSSAWANLLKQAYGYRPLYFSVMDGGLLKAVIPMMEVDSMITGKRGVSLPFSDYCEPLVPDLETSRDLFERIREYGAANKWKYIEIRGGEGYSDNAVPSSSVLKHVLELSEDEDRLLANFRKGTKSAIKKAISDGQLQMITSESEDALNEFYRLNSITRKRHGLPPQPYYYFRKLYDVLISRGHGFIVLASLGNRIIASGVFLHFGQEAVYKYGASDVEYQQLRPNNLVVWEAIKWYSRRGYKNFDFGRTEPDNEGLRIFKSGWNTKESKIRYYRYDLGRDAFVQNGKGINPLITKYLNKLPIPILELMGRMLYRHMG
jgi:lipid II:glycine glycyltransferase (peptidoglycan interpeptide bridge formation enzyme)